MPEISDIPIDDHTKYAQQIEQQRKEPLQYRDDRQVAGPAQVDVKVPSYPSQLKGFTGEEQCNVTFSAFAAPPEGTMKRTSCFSSEGLIPRLGSQQALSALKEKLDKMDKESE